MPTDAEIARYREDGAVCLRNAIPLEWIERMRAAVDDDMANPGPMVRINTPQGAPGLFFVDFQLWQRHPAARAAAQRTHAARSGSGHLRVDHAAAGAAIGTLGIADALHIGHGLEPGPQPPLELARADAVDHGLALAANETPATVGRARAATPPPPVGAAQAAISGCSRGSK